MTKLTSLEEVGRFALGLAVSLPVLKLTNLQLRAIQATDAKGDYRFADYLGLRCLATGVALVVITGISLVWAHTAGVETALVIFVVGAAKSAESISDVIYGLYQKHEQMDRIAIGKIIKGVGAVALAVTAIWLTRRVVWGVIAMGVWWITVLLTYDSFVGVRILRRYVGPQARFRPAWHGKVLARLAWLSLPMGIVMAIAALIAAIPRYFVAGYRGEEVLGYFAAIGYFVMAGQMIVAALGQTASPRLAKYFLYNKSAYVKLVVKLIILGATIGAAGIAVALLFGEFVLRIMYTAEYAAYNWLLVWFMVYGAIMCVGAFIGIANTAARRFRSQMAVSFAQVPVLLLLCYLLIPSFGTLGAVLSMLIVVALGYAGHLVIMILALRRGPLPAR